MNEDKELEELFQKAMRKANLTRNEALSYLVAYACQHGNIEDFRRVVNFVITTQEEEPDGTT